MGSTSIVSAVVGVVTVTSRSLVTDLRTSDPGGTVGGLSIRGCSRSDTLRRVVARTYFIVLGADNKVGSNGARNNTTGDVARVSGWGYGG